MQRIRLILPLVLIAQFACAQEIKFTDAHAQNGLLYPVASIKGNSDAEKTMNENILRITSEFDTQDFCIGQYGFVQQANFIQLHFYFNCMDMEESQNAYYLFDLGDGKICLPSTMFLDKQKDNIQRYFRTRITDFYATNGKDPIPSETLEQLTIDDFTVLLTEDGLSIRSSMLENWGDRALAISWLDLRPYLKTTFI